MTKAEYKQAVLGDNIEFFDQDFEIADRKNTACYLTESDKTKQRLTERRSLGTTLASAKASILGNPDKIMNSIYKHFTIKPFDGISAGKIVNTAVVNNLTDWKTVQAKAKSLSAQYPKVAIIGNDVQTSFSKARMDAKPLDNRIIMTYEAGKPILNSLKNYVDLFNAVTKDPTYQDTTKKLGNDPAKVDKSEGNSEKAQTTATTNTDTVNTTATNTAANKTADTAATANTKTAANTNAANTAKAPMPAKTPEQKQAANRTIATTLNKMGVDLNKLAKETENGETGYDTLRKALLGENYDFAKLKEELEENEDTVECCWCNELFDKTDCRKEVDLGYLCPQCVAAIKSRGEPLVFIENFDNRNINKKNKELTMINKNKTEGLGVFSPSNFLNNNTAFSGNSINVDAHDLLGDGNNIDVLEECDTAVSEGYDWDWNDYDYADPTDRDCEVVCRGGKNVPVAEDYEFDFTKRYDPENPEPFDEEAEGFLWDHCSFLNSDGETYVVSPEQAEAVIAYIPMYRITDATGHRHNKVVKNGKALPVKSHGKLFTGDRVNNVTYEKVDDNYYRVYVAEDLDLTEAVDSNFDQFVTDTMKLNKSDDEKAKMIYKHIQELSNTNTKTNLTEANKDAEDTEEVAEETEEAADKDPVEDKDLADMKGKVAEALNALLPEDADDAELEDAKHNMIDAVMAYFDKDDEAIEYIKSLVYPEDGVESTEDVAEEDIAEIDDFQKSDFDDDDKE